MKNVATKNECLAGLPGAKRVQILLLLATQYLVLGGAGGLKYGEMGMIADF